MTGPPATLLNARYIAIRTAEAKGLTHRLLQASHEKTPGVRRLLVPLLFRYWHGNREPGWTLVEQIAKGTVRFPGLPDLAALEIFGEVSVAILNASRHDKAGLARLGRIWRVQMDRILGSPVAYVARLLGRGLVLRYLAGSFARALKKQPEYQPVNYAELSATFQRPASFRQNWRRALDCLERPELAPGPILDVLEQPDLPFDLYVMLVCERALIYYGVHTNPSGMMDTLERIYHHGAPWFRQSILYALFHILTAWPHVPASMLDRYDALALEFYRSGSWQLQTGAGRYAFANQVANADAVTARHAPGRTPSVVAQLMKAAIGAQDQVQIAAMFGAIDGLAFYHGNGALALALIEQAYDQGGAMVEARAVASLASVRLLDQPLVDAFLQQRRSFARIQPEDVAAAEPSVGEEDLITLVDQFVVQSMLTSDDFRAQLCRAFGRALAVRSVDALLVQILEWVRDELGRLEHAPRQPGSG